MTKQIPLIPIAALPIMESLALRHGIPPAQVFAAAGIDITLARRKKQSFSINQFERVMDEVMRRSNTPHIGLRLGQGIQIDSLGLFGPLISSCTTPRRAIAAFSKFKRLVHPIFDIQLQETEQHSVILYASADELPIGNHPYYAEAMLTALVTLGGYFMGRPLTAAKVCFRHAQPAYFAEYQRIFNCPILFDQPFDAIYGDKTLLDQPMLSGNPEYHRDLLRQGTEELNLHTSPLLELISHLVMAHIDDAGFGLTQTAKVLCVSARTLQRELKKHDTNFNDLKAEVRFNYAKDLLEQQRKSIDETAQLLGYSDRSNFVHTFKRWAKVSPSEFKNEHKIGYQREQQSRQSDSIMSIREH